MIPIVWATHPRHLPKPPGGRVVVVDVAFAAGRQWKTKTWPFVEALGPGLVRWIDHHEHPEAWATVADDPRFVLVPNQEAHACPELITPALVQACGHIHHVVAHCDFDGAVSAVKWRCGGRAPWPEADEDARATDSPGRGHTLTARGARLAAAMDEAHATYEMPARLSFMTRLADAMTDGDESLALEEEVNTLAAAAAKAETEAATLAQGGKDEVEGVFVIRVKTPLDARFRRALLIAAEERAPIGVVVEPDPTGGMWLTAATFDATLDLAGVEGLDGGRSDFRFARAHDGGHAQVTALGDFLARHRALNSQAKP